MMMMSLLLMQLLLSTALANPEVSILIKAKQALTDPNSHLSDWKPTDSTPCNWTGITCSLSSAGNPTVTSITLTNFDLSGPFPSALCLLPNLNFLSLSFNYINSTLRDSSLQNCAALTHLDLSQNFLVGVLPSMSSCRLLRHLDLAGNNFSGAIPPSFAGLRRLEILSLTANLLDETIPSFIGSMSTLVQLNLSYNPFSASSIPYSFANLSNLETLWLAGCGIVGAIPPPLGRLSKLTNLDLSGNFLAGVIPETLTGLSSVVQIELYSNRLTGELPAGLSNLTKLRFIDVAMNYLSGEIPDDVFSIPLLQSLHLYKNQFTGSLPAAAATAVELLELRVFANYLSGPLPANLGENSPFMFLDISSNQLTGEIPKGVCRGGILREFLLFNNHISGGLPRGLGDCRTLTRVRLANNRLSGEVPAGVWGLPRIEIFDLSYNSLSGSMSSDIAGAANLKQLDLHNNNFSGGIPIQLQYLKLVHLNLSNNQFSGPIPPLLLNEEYKTSFLGNPGLCFDLNGRCSSSTSGRRKLFWLLAVILLAAIVAISLLYLWSITTKKQKNGMDKSWWILHSFQKLGFSQYEVLDSLQECNVIGRGPSGKVFKVVLRNGETVAVKKICKEKVSKFDHEEVGCDAFRSEVAAAAAKLRHKNVVKLLGCCSHMDFNLLVYEYMSNGSLGDLLQSNKMSHLDWPIRYKIALDASEGLCYLHHECFPPIVHRDFKPNNVLLDAEFRAKVGDFGVVNGSGPKSMSAIVGSRGYMAPEYPYTLRLNEKSDIYSLGVVILELVTGKSAVDPEFGKKGLVWWVCSNIQEKGEDSIVDAKLDFSYKLEIVKVLHIGLLCTSSLPIDRPSMRRVVKMLLEVGTESKTASYCIKNDKESFA